MLLIFSNTCFSQSVSEIDELTSSIDNDTTLSTNIYHHGHAIYDSITDSGALTAKFDNSNNLIRIKRKSIDDEKGISYSAYYYFQNNELIFFTFETFRVSKKSFTQYIINDQDAGQKIYFKNGELFEFYEFKNGKWVKEEIENPQIVRSALVEKRLSDFLKRELKSS